MYKDKQQQKVNNLQIRFPAAVVIYSFHQLVYHVAHIIFLSTLDSIMAQ